MITEDYVSFKTAKILKEKGFDEFCSHYYGPLTDTDNEYKFEKFFSSILNSGLIDDAYTAPTLQMAMKWLREKEWFICIIPLAFYCGEKAVKFGYNIWAGDNLEIDESSTPEFNTYEEACEAAIKYCLENLI